MQGTSNRISRLLARFNVRTVHIPANKNVHLLTPLKDNLGLKTPGIYFIPCKCSKVYMGRLFNVKANNARNWSLYVK
jgi:hypothetical protein